MNTFFPKSLKDLYRAVCTWQRIHFKACQHIAEAVKKEYRHLKDADKSRGKKAHWIKSAKDMGFCNIDDGRSGIIWSPARHAKFKKSKEIGKDVMPLPQTKLRGKSSNVVDGETDDEEKYDEVMEQSVPQGESQPQNMPSQDDGNETDDDPIIDKFGSMPEPGVGSDSNSDSLVSDSCQLTPVNGLKADVNQPGVWASNDPMTSVSSSDGASSTGIDDEMDGAFYCRVCKITITSANALEHVASKILNAAKAENQNVAGNGVHGKPSSQPEAVATIAANNDPVSADDHTSGVMDSPATLAAAAAAASTELPLQEPPQRHGPVLEVEV